MLPAAPSPVRTYTDAVPPPLGPVLPAAPSPVRAHTDAVPPSPGPALPVAPSDPRSEAIRLWSLVGALGAVAALLEVLAAHLPGASQSRPMPLWALTALFVAAEMIVVTVHIRREGHVISASGIPLVLGLFLAGPAAVIPAQLIGALPVMLLRRRPPLKTALELAGLAAGAGAAVLVFRLIGSGTTGPDSLLAWGAASAAALAAALVGVGVLAAAAALGEGAVEREALLHVGTLTALATATNLSLALLAVLALHTTPADAGLVIIPVAALSLSFRLYTVERQRNQGIELLYDSTRAFHQTPEMELAILDLLSGARTMFKVEHAELTLIQADESGRAFRTSVGAADRISLMTPVELTAFEEVVTVVGDTGDGMLLSRSGDPTVTEYLEQRQVHDAMLVPLRGERGVLGIMMVADRLGGVAGFDNGDLKLLATLASHATISLENGRLEQSVDRLTALQTRLEHQAFHDALTGLANRSLFTNRVEHSLGRRRRQVAVLFVDLDDFKTINDSLGHAAGDELLKAVARRLQECLRPSDTAARLGGDEFAVLLEDINGLPDATAVAERIVTGLGRPLHVSGRQHTVQASVGVVVGRAGESAADELLRNADVAMYIAKGHGKGRYQVFEPKMQAAVLERHELKAELAVALQRGDLQVHYQPIIDLRTNRIIGTEALARWYHAERGNVSPGEFIPLAEETGLIGAIGLMVLRTACEQARRWRDEHRDAGSLEMAVNLSPRQLQLPRFIDDVAAILGETGVDPADLTLEITETAIMDRMDLTVARLRSLKELGVRLAIDDFGTGHSSLSSMREFPVDVLKIAKPFVDGLLKGPERVALVKAVVNLGEALQLEMVAEGIEEERQGIALRDMGVQYGQGFFYHRPSDPLIIGAHLAAQARRRQRTKAVKVSV